MNPFKVTCVTCRARLSVRDESAIGQIFACPRCGSMVHVAAPTLASAATLSSAAANATPAPTPAPLDDASFVLDGDDSPTAPPSLATPTAATFEDAVEVAGAAEQPPTFPPAPAARPLAGGWGPLKFAAVIGGAALAGSALVAATLILWNRNQTPPGATIAAHHPPTESTPSEPAKAKSAPPTAPAESPIDETAGTAPASAPEPALPDPDAILAFDPPTDQPAGDPPATEAPAANPNPLLGRSNDSPAPPEDAPLAAAPPEQPTPRLHIDPLELDPEGLDLRTLLDGPSTDPLDASQAAAPSDEAAASMAPPPVPHAAAAPPDPADAPVRRETLADGAKPGHVDALVARRYESVKVDGMPLSRFIDFAGEMSGLPISVTSAMLRRAAVSSATAVKVDAQDATIEETLTASLAPLRLAPRLDGSHVVLERTGGDKQRTVEYKVDDLAADDDAVKQLAERLQRYAAPATWQAAGGESKLAIDGQTLRVDALESTQYEALFFLERYRAALGLPTRTKYPASMLAPASPHAELAERLRAPTTFTFSQYTPLRDIFRYWHDELDVAVLVDWPALASERLAPQTRIAASAAEQPWAEALDAVLTPLGLTWRAIDARTIEITSLQQDRAQPEVAFYRLPPGAPVDAAGLAAQVDQLVSETATDNAGAGTAQHASDYDAARRLLMVRLPAAAHRRLAAWLAEQSLLAPR